MRRLLLASVLLLAGCGRQGAHADDHPSPPIDRPAEGHVAAAAVDVAKPVVAVRAAVAPIHETGEPAPADLELRVAAKDDGFALVARRRGALLSIRQGAVRASGADEAVLEVDGAAPMVVESTQVETLETTRVVVKLSAPASEGEAPRFVAHLADAPRRAGGDQREAHACRAHEDGFGGFALVCRIGSQANVASITGDDARDGVFVVNGPTTLARIDMALDGQPEVSKAIAYNTHGRGVLVRAEASQLAGEEAPSFVVLSQARAQPVVRPVARGCFLRIDPMQTGGDTF